MGVYFDMAPGDTVDIGAGTKVTLIQKTGTRAKVRVDSEYKIQIHRADDKPAAPAPAQHPAIKRPSAG
jgi:sRNA-binding carbon storage regulator CsrA